MMILLNIINIILCGQSLRRNYAQLGVIIYYISSGDLYFSDASLIKNLIPSQKLSGLFLGISKNLFIRRSILPPFCWSNCKYFSTRLRIICVFLSVLSLVLLLISQYWIFVQKDQIIQDLNPELSNCLVDFKANIFIVLASFPAVLMILISSVLITILSDFLSF